MRKLALLAATAFAATAVPASATITINDLQQTSHGETVEFPVQPDGTTVIGFTNQTDTQVDFSTLTGQTLTTPSQGQARIEAVGADQLNSLVIDLHDPTTTFSYIEFNLFGTHATGDSVTVIGFDQNGTPYEETFDLGNGENFLTAIAASDQTIDRIEFNIAGGGVPDLRQVRISGLSGPNVPVPEPGTWAMMIVGFGAAGVAMRRSRRRKEVLTQLA